MDFGDPQKDFKHTTLPTYPGDYDRVNKKYTPIRVGVTLLENHRPRPFAFGKVEIRREVLSVAHRNHHVLLGHFAKIRRHRGRGQAQKNGRTQSKQKHSTEHGWGFHGG